MKYISFGGLGDSFIVYLKLMDRFAEGEKIDWLHVESNEIVPKLVKECYLSPNEPNDFILETETDANYEEHFKEGKWKDRIPLNTAIDGNYHFPAQDDGIKSSPILFDENDRPEKLYDVSIQASAGAKDNRKWKFDPNDLVKFLIVKGYKAELIHSRRRLQENIDIIECSKVFVGLSGFHTYWSLSCGIPNIHLEESDEHNHHYIHPDWNQYRYGIKIGSLKEVLDGLKYWKIL